MSVLNLSTTPFVVSKMISVNLPGPFQLVQAVAGQMIMQEQNPRTGQRGSVVMISSIAAIWGEGIRRIIMLLRRG
jgi:NAD(P)-dependent dehydrogenase (short-subunit alcohol dehydrogenase family)